MQILGIDVGGTGIKAAIVETTTGELISERTRVETPRPATPEAFEWNEIPASTPTRLIS